MREEFAPYQQSLDMKELGFDEACFSVYQPEMDGKYYLFSINVDDIGSNNSDSVEYIACTAPTYSQAFRWFREEYGLEGITQRAEDFMWYKWTIHQYNENGKKYVADWYEYKTYEEAELECLKKLIEICCKLK